MKTSYFFASLILAAFAFLPDSVSAQQSLVGGICQGSTCSACHFIDLGNRLIIWLIGVITVLFGVLMVIAGFQFLTAGGNPSVVQSAKEKFTNGLIGFLIVLAAWLLIDTLMRGLLPGNTGTITGYGPWAQVQCWSQTQSSVVAGTLPTGVYRAGSGTADPVSGSVTPPSSGSASGASNTTHSAALSQLSAGNFQVVSSGNCTDPTNSTCTSLTGVQPLTIQRAVELQQAVGQQLVITGGTETGHATMQYSHANGYKLDFRTTTALNNYITQNFTSIGNNRWRDPNGNIYYRHGASTNSDHWDVTFTN